MGFGVQDRLVIGVTGDWRGLGRVAGQSAPKDLRPFCSPRDSAPPYDNLFMVRAQRQRRWRLRMRSLCKLAPMRAALPAGEPKSIFLHHANSSRTELRRRGGE